MILLFIIFNEEDFFLNKKCSQSYSSLRLYVFYFIFTLSFQLYCQQNEPFREEMCKSWLFTDYCTPVNITVRNNDQDFMNALLFINKTNQVKYS